MKAIYYVKSFEEDFSTKTLKGPEKVTFQSVYDIVKKGVIKPNTKSFGRKKRLSTTILSNQYHKTYRPHGIIFTTEQKPEYILPFDLVLLSATENIIVHYYRIKNNLHVYYNHSLIKGFESFIFKDFNAMIKKYPSPKKVWIAVNKFRKSHGYETLPKEKYRLVEYNEATFHTNVKITPIALFGYLPKTREIGRELGLPVFRTAKNFYEYEKKK